MTASFISTLKLVTVPDVTWVLTFIEPAVSPIKDKEPLTCLAVLWVNSAGRALPSISIFHSSGLQVTEGVHLFAASDPAKATTDDVAGTIDPKGNHTLHVMYQCTSLPLPSPHPPLPPIPLSLAIESCVIYRCPSRCYCPSILPISLLPFPLNYIFCECERAMS